MPDRGPAPEVLEFDVSRVAHGGHCVARVGDDPHGRVVFVRHALPGERVRARVTEDAGGRLLRADAIEVLAASPDRVPAPCPHAGPGRCGGCDWQHARPEAQRRFKADVVREQFARLAGLEVEVEVEALPGGPLGWRTRIGYAIDTQGRAGLHRHRSHEVEVITSCPLGHPGVGDHTALQRRWPPGHGLVVTSDDDGHVAVLTSETSPVEPARRGRPGQRTRPAPPRVHQVEGPTVLHHRVGGLALQTDPTTFWQVHPAAAGTLVAAVVAGLEPEPADTVLDLYAGAGLFTAALADAVGPSGRVLGVESSPVAVADAAVNLSTRPWAEVICARVTARSLGALAGPPVSLARPDLVVLDPPRAGAGEQVIAQLITSGPRRVAYVSCDPATLARDVRFARDRGWQLRSLRAIDAFPMTHHVECVALLTPN